MSRKTLYWTAAGVLLTAVSLVIAIVSLSADGGRSQSQSGQGNVQGGDDSIVVGGDLTIQSEKFKNDTAGMTRAEAEQTAQKYLGISPPVGKPAPYLVVGAPRHLWVRSSGTYSGRHIGAAADGSVIWADCTDTTDFDPELGDDAGPQWLRIRWPTNQQNESLMASQPSDQYAGWVYAWYTLPAGHNGKIPTCAKQ